MITTRLAMARLFASVLAGQETGPAWRWNEQGRKKFPEFCETRAPNAAFVNPDTHALQGRPDSGIQSVPAGAQRLLHRARSSRLRFRPKRRNALLHYTRPNRLRTAAATGATGDGKLYTNRRTGFRCCLPYTWRQNSRKLVSLERRRAWRRAIAPEKPPSSAR